MRKLVLLAALVLSFGFSDPPRGWNSISESEFGFSFNYPAEFRLLPAKDLTHRVLELREGGGRVEIEVRELEAHPQNSVFVAEERKHATEGSFQVIEDKEPGCTLAYSAGEDDICRKTLKGSHKSFVLTVVYRQNPDAKKRTANRNNAERIAKSLRRMG